MPMPDSASATSQCPADLTIRAASSGELNLVARVRARCYRASYALEHKMRDATRTDRADAAAGDFLIAEQDGRLVGTTTCMRGQMNVRGAIVPCQGIAYVGTTHDARRSGGVASAIMWHALGVARERGEVLSALMPFRASYYEHFGYGLCERRALWTIPIPILPSAPKGEQPTFRFVEPDDDAMLQKLGNVRRRQFEHLAIGHGDVAFPHAPMGGWRHWADWYTESGYLFADIAADGSVRGAMGVHQVDRKGQKGLQAMHSIYTDPAGLIRQLQFLATLRDQYSFIEIATPADVPLNALLRETQIPHRGVEHAHATCEMSVRNQVRVLDHLTLLNAMAWPNPLQKGLAVIAVRESEGHESRFAIDIADGRCVAKSSQATAQFTCADKTWAAIALGEMSATFATMAGLADCGDSAVVELMDGLGHGPLPFCREYF